MACSTIGCLATSMLLHRGKMNAEQIINGSLAGGIMIGASCDMIVSPFISLIIGFCAGVTSTTGIHFLEKPFYKFLYLHDTAAIAWVHMVPGFIGGLISALIAGVTPEREYGTDIQNVYKFMGAGYDRSNSTQGGIQIAAIFTTIGIALGAGIFTGLTLRIPMIWNSPMDLYNDKEFFKFEGGDHDENMYIDEENDSDHEDNFYKHDQNKKAEAKGEAAE